MRRRTACSAFVLGAASPAVLAQIVGRQARIGFLIEVLDPFWQRAALEPLRRGLRELGYIEGENMVFEIRSARGQKRAPEAADERVAAAQARCAGRRFSRRRTGRQGFDPNAARGRGRCRQPGRHGARCDDGTPRRQYHGHQRLCGRARRQAPADRSRARPGCGPGGHPVQSRRRSACRTRSRHSRMATHAPEADPRVRSPRAGRIRGRVRGHGARRRRGLWSYSRTETRT